jgi:hypothetical protein
VFFTKSKKYKSSAPIDKNKSHTAVMFPGAGTDLPIPDVIKKPH